jgi:hypothetical protein
MRTIMCNEMNNNNWSVMFFSLFWYILESLVQDFNNYWIFPTYLFAPKKKKKV